MDDLISEIKKRVDKNQRVLVTTLTKRMAEDLAEYLSKNKVKVRYLHSEIENLQRTEIIRQLRLGEFDVLVGINLLREGLDIPEVCPCCHTRCRQGGIFEKHHQPNSDIWKGCKKSRWCSHHVCRQNDPVNEKCHI